MIQIQTSLIGDLERRFESQLEENKQIFTHDTEAFVEKTKKSDDDFDTLNCALEQTNINLSGKIQENFQEGIIKANHNGKIFEKVLKNFGKFLNNFRESLGNF